MKQRFRWTKAKYKQAARLARISPIFHERGDSEAPLLLQRYWKLWGRHPQYDDPLAGQKWERIEHMRAKHLPDDLPF